MSKEIPDHPPENRTNECPCPLCEGLGLTDEPSPSSGWQTHYLNDEEIE